MTLFGFVTPIVLLVMTIHETTRGDLVIMRPDGRITVETEQQLKQAVANLLAAGHTRLVLNLAEVGYVDSCGLGRIVQAYTSTRRHGGDFKLLNVGPRIRHLLAVTRLDTVLEILPSETDAEQWLAARERTKEIGELANW